MNSKLYHILEQSDCLTTQQLSLVKQHLDLPTQEFIGQLIDKQLLTDWQADQILAGQESFSLGSYQIISKLGSGAGGTVFKAKEEFTNRLVAIKVLISGEWGQATAVARFQREIQTISSLSHQNIVQCLKADQIGETRFLVMEYVDGMDLAEFHSKRKNLPIDWVCECVRQIALGLEHARQAGMVHRDIKPSNIFLVNPQEGQVPTVKILDFGIARSFKSSAKNITQTGEVLGSFDYISVEQGHDSKHVDIRSDIFSLGCVLFELLTDQLPYQGENAVEKLVARALHPAPRVSSLRAIPTELDDLVAQMLEREVEDRIQTPLAVAKILANHAMKGVPSPRDRAATVVLDALSCEETKADMETVYIDMNDVNQARNNNPNRLGLSEYISSTENRLEYNEAEFNRVELIESVTSTSTTIDFVPKKPPRKKITLNTESTSAPEIHLQVQERSKTASSASEVAQHNDQNDMSVNDQQSNHAKSYAEKLAGQHLNTSSQRKATFWMMMLSGLVIGLTLAVFLLGYLLYQQANSPTEKKHQGSAAEKISDQTKDFSETKSSNFLQPGEKLSRP